MKTPSEEYSVSICIAKCDEEDSDKLVQFLNSEMEKAIKAAGISDNAKVDAGVVKANPTTSPITYGGHVALQFRSGDPLQVTQKILKAAPSAEVSFN